MSPSRPSVPGLGKASLWRRGAPFALEVAGPKPPRLVVFKDDGATGYFYAVDAPEDRPPEMVDGVFVYTVDPLQSLIPEIAEVRWSADGDRAALFFDGVPQAAFDFARQRGFGRLPSSSASSGPWPLHEHVWDSAVVAGLE